jgi:16S rRNA (cytosine967-C5)-methyltransferase
MAKQTAREQALTILTRVDTQQSYVTPLLDQVSKQPDLDERDRALIHQLVKGTLAWRGRLDTILEERVKGGLQSISPDMRNVLRLGAYQILYLDRIPKEVAVHETVELAKQFRHAGLVKLVNAVLRTIARQADLLRSPTEQPQSATAIAEQYSHPLWMIERWLRDFGTATTIALCEANNRPWPVCLRTNMLRTTTTSLRATLQAAGAEIQPAHFHPDCTLLLRLPANERIHTLKAFQEGLFLIQDESFALVGNLVNPQPGELILDLCASPGGKTTHLAELMGNRGEIVAVDHYPARLPPIRENCERLGITIVKTQAADARIMDFERLADRVLLDVPCSGTGVLGRRSDARWNKVAENLPSLLQLQRDLLANAAYSVRPGGYLIYTTCSLESEENQDVITAFLNAFPNYQRTDLTDLVPDELIDDQGYFRTWPHIHQTGGAFGVVLQRSAAPT